VTHKYAIYSALLLAITLGANAAPAQFGGTMPPHEVMAVVRSMGFDPIGRPAYSAGRYVVRATDPRGANVNVVVDAQLHRVVLVRPIPSSEVLPPAGALPPGRTATLPPEYDGPGGALRPRAGGLTDDGIPAPRPPRGLPNQSPARPPLSVQGPRVPPAEASVPENGRDMPTGSIPAPSAGTAKLAPGHTGASADRRPDIVISNHPPYVHTRPLPATNTSTPPAGAAPGPQAATAAAPAVLAPTGPSAPTPKPAAVAEGAGTGPTAAAPRAATPLPPVAPLD
jgi:hypothetical protein